MRTLRGFRAEVTEVAKRAEMAALVVGMMVDSQEVVAG